MKAVCLERIRVAGLEELREPRELQARSRRLAVVVVVVEQRAVECIRVVRLPAGRPAAAAGERMVHRPLRLRSKEQ